MSRSERMKHRYNNVSKNINLYSPTQNSIVFHVLYIFKIQNGQIYGLQVAVNTKLTQNYYTITITDFATRQVQHLAGGFLKRVLTII
jgi:hypothetical protein